MITWLAAAALAADRCAGRTALVKADAPPDDLALAQGCGWEAKGTLAGWEAAAEWYGRVEAPVGRYLLARVTARMRAVSGPCEHGDGDSAVLAPLSEAAADPTLAPMIAADAAFAKLRGAVRYRLAAGQTPEQIAASPVGLKFYAETVGAYGHPYIIELRANGALWVRKLVLSQDVPPSHPESVRPGGWSSPGGTRLKLDVGEGPFELDLAPGGGYDGGGRRWFDAWAECDA
ncbi:MAG: hypothetical protein ABMA64_09435 [Myxococcota bacterium]